MNVIRIKQKLLSIMLLSLLTFSISSIFSAWLFQVEAQAPMASLTGIIYDNGVDMNIDGTFDYLVIGVEVNVTTAGTFRVMVSDLLDSLYNYISVQNEVLMYLDVGLQVVDVSLHGPTIYSSGFNPSNVSDIDLYDEEYNWLDFLWGVSLSREYAYTEFDSPPASLTGIIHDNGVDLNSDGTFDLLEVGVEVNVSTAGTFVVETAGLYDSAYNYIAVSSQNITYLDVGIQVVYMTLDGPIIYILGFNPRYVSNIYLHDEYSNWLDYLSDISLSREYLHTEFDPPPASLTDTVFDRGVDVDNDGTFNYLEVSVEVNVTEAGEYMVGIWGLVASDFNWISIEGSGSEHLSIGTHLVNVSLYGPTIYTSGLNPANISMIRLFSVEYYPPFTYMPDWLETISDVPLSREYLFMEFDSPFQDMAAHFVVYPNGRVVMGGALNYSDMEVQNPYYFLYGVAGIDKTDTITEVSTNFTFLMAEDLASQFPYNSSDVALSMEYSDGLLMTAINGSTILLPSLASELPFNITDFAVKGDFADGMISGNISVDMWNGFPLDDVVVDIQGNNTYLHLSGSTTVIFGIYPNLGEINATILEYILGNLTGTFEGQGPSSLYNRTNGILEFTMLNNVTTLHNGNATVDFEAKIEGDLILALANMTGQSAMYDLFTTVWSSVESGSLLLTYAHALSEVDMNFVFVANITSLINNVIPILPDLLPPDEASFIESLLNTTYGTVNSAQILMNYENGQITFTADVTILDLNAELNYIKSLFILYNFPSPLTSQLQAINETQLDLISLDINFNVAETSVEIDIKGFAVLPPLDWIDSTNFQLERFFNITAMDGYEPPGKGAKLKVTVAGGSNETHTVTILRPGSVPEPDVSAPGGMIWENQSISGLKDLIFHIGPLDATPPVIGIPIQAPEIPDDSEAVTVSVNVTDGDSGVRPDGVTLSYRTNSGAWINITMNKMIGDLFEGEILGFPGGTYVEYMIIAYDYANNVAIDDRSGAYYVYTVIAEFPVFQTLVVALVLAGLIIIVIRRKWGLLGDSLSQLGQKVRMLLSI